MAVVTGSVRANFLAAATMSRSGLGDYVRNR
jgi:hypothetical protein